MKTWRIAGSSLSLVLATFLLIPTMAEAHDETPAVDPVEEAFEAGRWGKTASLGVNMLQSYYTTNWNGGNKGSFVWNGTFDALAKKKLGTDYTWTNTMGLAFGQNHLQDRDQNGDLFWKSPDKTIDEIKAETMLRYLKTEFDPFFSVRFESQFLDQTDPLKEFTLNPLEFYETLGVSRMLVDNDERKLLARLGFTLHQSLRDIYLPATDAVSGESTNDGGLELIFDYKTAYFENRVDYTSQLRFYKPVYYSAQSDFDDLTAANITAAGVADDIADYTMAVDIDFINTFKANITKVINVQLDLRWVFDKYDNTVPLVFDDAGDLVNAGAVNAAVRKSGQFRQTTSIGLGYTF